ncbi:uncharacterized protein LOC134719507 [Mytilus trossulus]|uniref:uncharacterized protein LOC134719507 n=1 Tax=Mytilus trossulus TaxID=6551 RepID=UPI0030079232
MNIIYLTLLLTFWSIECKLSRQQLWWFVDENFKTLDVNHDGLLELTEYERVMKEDDGNHDGVYTCAEYSKFTGEPKSISYDIFNHLDSNSDCSMSHQEWSATYHHMDNSGDGIVSRVEFDNFIINILTHLGHDIILGVPSGTEPR